MRKNIKFVAIEELLSRPMNDRRDLDLAKRAISKKYGFKILTNAEILKAIEEKKIKVSRELMLLLRKRSIRTMSGIAPVAVLTKPYPCPGNCAFCPAEKDVPQSYLSNEPAVMRAIRCGFDPYVQVQDRLRALVANGHEPEKIELIVIGGTWSYLPEKYKYWFIANCFKAANDFVGKNQKSKIKNQNDSLKCKINDLKKTLLREQRRNERGRYRIVGLTLETRPDFINEKELWQMRELGCTRVELGVQIVDDGILGLNKRGHGVKAISDATALLRRFGFKITYHLMPGLPGATPAKDFKMFKRLFEDERFQPDQIKFYPTVVTKGSLLYRWWKAGKYKPYSDKQLKRLIIKCKSVIPEYVRVIRLIRDIPGESIIAGNRITNLRQVMKDKGAACKCIRCREIGNSFGSARDRQELRIINYKVSGGEEFFIQAATSENKLLGFCRLFLPAPGIAGAFRSEPIAMIRELHVYGELARVGRAGRVQHSGLGRLLLAKAEELSRKEKYAKIKIISGVGVRAYYRKFGYSLQGSYMEKKLK